MKVFFCTLFILLLIKNIKATETQHSQNVLVIHSYHQTFDWTDKTNSGIIKVLSSNKHINNIFIEYLDYKRHQNNDLYQYYSQLFYAKYKTTKISSFIVSDNGAYEFIKLFRNDFFPEIPIIFCGVNTYNKSEETIDYKTTGIYEFNDIIGSIDLSLELFNNTSDLVFLTDTTITSRLIYSDSIERVKKKYPELNIHILKNLDKFVLNQKLEQLPSTSICFILGYFIDKDGHYESYEKRLPALANDIDLPIFSFLETYLGYGIVGGNLVNPDIHGKMAGEICLSILEGNDAESIPVVDSIGIQWMFDYNLLKRFNISENNLPIGSKIINKPPTSYVIDKKIALFIAGLLFLLFIITMLLFNHITKRKETEKQLLKAKEKAEKASNLKTEFLAQMSHEIRTPINIILSYTNLIKMEVSDKDISFIKEYFDSIETGSQRLIKTIDSILKVSEIQSGVVEVEKNTTDLYDDILAPLVAEFKLHASKKGLKIKLQRNSNIFDVFVDQFLIKQAVANLIDNAIKYSNSGTITISLEVNSSNNIVLLVNDEGIGIDKDYLSNIFEPFSQEMQGYGRIYEGNGLGLTLVKKYCDLNNAQISIKSIKDVGTTFKISFL